MWDALIIFAAYLFGAIPVVYLIGRMRGVDLSKEEDMHISLWHKVGRLEGFIGISWDIAKGAIAVVVASVFDLELWVIAGVGLAVIVGELWPVFLNFRGEKANTTGLGMGVALVSYQTPWVLPFAFVPIALGAGIRTLPRFFSSKEPLDERLKFGGSPSLSLPLGMLIGFAFFPLGCWLMDLPWEVTIACLVLFILIAIKRVVVDLRKELKTATSKKSILINRFLFDRSQI